MVKKHLLHLRRGIKFNKTMLFGLEFAQFLVAVMSFPFSLICSVCHKNHTICPSSRARINTSATSSNRKSRHLHNTTPHFYAN